MMRTNWSCTLPVVTGIALLAGSIGGSAATSALEWDMLSYECQADLIVPCGSLGYLHFENIGDNCGEKPPKQSIPALYSKSQACAPVGPGGLIVLGRTNQSPQQTPDFDPPQPAPYPQAPGALCSTPTLLQPLSESSHRGFHVLDWDSWHGRTLVRLIDSLAEPETAVLRALNDPAVAPVLGDNVTDAHVLAGLCAVVQETEDGTDPYPIGAYLGIGRQPRDGWDECGGTPDLNRLSGWIGQALSELRNRDVPTIAAAGNYGELLFPACREETLAVGSLDLDLENETQGIWESPEDIRVQALSPGQALSVRSVLTPPGSSYAGAFLAGCYANQKLSDPKFEAELTDSTWTVESGREEQQLQFTDGKALLSCNDESLNETLSCIQSGECADVESQRTLSLTPVSNPIASIPSLAQWVSCIHLPQPEDPFCVPCVGRRNLGNIVVDRSFLVGNRDNDIASTYLRVGDSYWLINGELGNYRAVTLASAANLVGEEQPSLVAVWRPKTPPACLTDTSLDYHLYWTSSPIQMDTWQP